MTSVRQRIAELEQRVGTPDSACPHCGASWEGSLYAESHPDGRLVARCWRCNGDRPLPKSGYVKVLSAELVEFI
jgi:hypothetical protein